MVRILELLSWAGEELKKADTNRTIPQNARLDAQVLLAHTLGVSAAYLFSHGDDLVSQEHTAIFERCIARRARHEPVAYITQEKAFFNRNFFVNRHTLIPRPDTEVLVETLIPIIRTAQEAQKHPLIIDIGTGSGAVAITLAKETNAPTIAIDESPEALTVAKHNAQTLGADIALASGNLFSPIAAIPTPPSTHLILAANLPYLTPWQWEALDPDVKNYEPKSALVGGADGLFFYDALCNQMKIYLHEQSRNGNRITFVLGIEIDPSQKITAPALFASYFPKSDIQVISDYTGKPRVVVLSYS